MLDQPPPKADSVEHSFPLTLMKILVIEHKELIGRKIKGILGGERK